ncbi:MAG TPA: Clp protease N-terminal domain-containing protein [Ktedonobacteraceae bacterium]|nr:Clp protease N-terminal domain-containing protein [Ktedonobacteraceae bacterium]
MSEQELEGFVQKMLSQEASFARFADKFSEKAQRALLFANEEAQLFNHNFIGTEHLLLGLLREGTGTAAKVLNEYGIEIQKVRKAIEFIIGRGKEPVEGEPGLTPRSQVVIALAVSEGWRSPGHHIDTEHLLLGIIREGEGIGAAIIERLGPSLEQVRTKVLQALLDQNIPVESLKDAVKNKSNVVACRVDGHDLDAIDVLVEVGIRSTRSDAASWLIHAGIEANRAILESVHATVAEIRQLRTKAQAVAQQLLKTEDAASSSSTRVEEESAGDEGSS